MQHFKFEIQWQREIKFLISQKFGFHQQKPESYIECNCCAFFAPIARFAMKNRDFQVDDNLSRSTFRLHLNHDGFAFVPSSQN